MSECVTKCPCCDGEGYFYGDEKPPHPWGDSDTIEALKRENEALREALSPFAEYMHTPEGRMDLANLGAEVADNLGVGWIYLTHGDFRRARAALSAPDRQREG